MAFEIEQPIDAGPSPVVEPTKPRLLGVLGPGLITGASDDDPSGIATYSQAGAQFGYALTCTMLFTHPLMTAVQIVSARMGRWRTTGRGIAGNLRQHCPPWLRKREFDFLGYSFGRMYSARTGQARLGYRPSRKSIRRMVENIHALTARSGTWQETTE
jgi:Natural resistance-associated macrophage protein-like